MRPPRYVLMDIEGTTTPLSFVHEVLFPYSAAHLAAYVRDHGADAEVERCLQATQATVLAEQGHNATGDEAVSQLLAWIKEDRKHPALKTLQGLVWEAGYKDGAFTADLYPDVRPALEAWHGRGARLGIYSSGSVAAQKLLFGHTPDGDLTPLLSDFFDTAVGGKREPASYAAILGRLGLAGDDVAFLSDVAQELDAARATGLRTVQLVRPGTPLCDAHPTAADFRAVDALLFG